MTGDFKLEQVGELQLFSIPAFAETGLVIHGFSTRFGGVSQGPYTSLNLGLGKGDREERVIENRYRFLNSLGLDLKTLVAAQQVHGTRVVSVTKRDRGRGAASYHDGIPAADALITATPGITLSTYFADCVPLFFLDPCKKAIGVAHAGWKGTVDKIGQATLRQMEEEFGTDISKCLVGIGPSIGPCCYEVDRQVLEPLSRGFSYWQELVAPRGEGRWFLNLWETNRRQLLDVGVSPKNIFQSNLCTACNETLFFSYRAHNKITGSLAAVIALRERG